MNFYKLLCLLDLYFFIQNRKKVVETTYIAIIMGQPVF